MKRSNPKADNTRKREDARQQADDQREEVVLEGIENDPGAEEMAKDALRKATDGDDRDVDKDEEETLEEAAGGPMIPTDERRELSHRESPPEDAEEEARPNPMSEGP